MTDKTQSELTDGEEPTTTTEPIYGDGQEAEDDHPLGEKRPLNHGVKIRGKVKRGEDTRDQDELLIEGRGEDAEEAAADFEDALTKAEQQDWADRLRDLQPDEDGETDE